jgi:sulfatase modifying factor 1
MKMVSVAASERYPTCASFVGALRREGEEEKLAAGERAAREKAEREAAAGESQEAASRDRAAKEQAERAQREAAGRAAQVRAAQEQAYPVATPQHAARTERLTYSIRGQATREIVVSAGFLGIGRSVERRVEDVEARFTMVVIPPCHFTMGSPPREPDRRDNETQHEVRLTLAYAMATTPVTQALYQAVMGANPSNCTQGSEAPQRPVEQVSWYDALRFCNALSAKVGLRPAYTIGGGDAPDVTPLLSADGFRLPTEAEWECAARAGTAHVYAGGDDLDAVGWHNGNSGSTTHAVGQKRANSWGLHDLSGNVWEWVSDWYGAYPSGSVTDPQGASVGPDRVYRGGSWGNTSGSARAAYRYGSNPGGRGGVLGLRLSRTMP